MFHDVLQWNTSLLLCGQSCLQHAISDSPTVPASCSVLSVVRKANSFGTTPMDGVNYYSLQHYPSLDGVQGNLLSYHVCETRPVSRIMAEPIRQRQSHSIEIKPRWKSCSWETSPERLSDAGNYSSANTPADLQLLYHLIRALWMQKALVAECDEMSQVAWPECVADYSNRHCQDKSTKHSRQIYAELVVAAWCHWAHCYRIDHSVIWGKAQTASS